MGDSRQRAGRDGYRSGNELQSAAPLHPHFNHVDMHELSIATSIVEIAGEELSKHGGERVRSVHLQLGSMSGVAKDALLFCFGMACEGTPAEGSSLVIEETEGREMDIVRLEIEP